MPSRFLFASTAIGCAVLLGSALPTAVQADVNGDKRADLEIKVIAKDGKLPGSAIRK